MAEETTSYERALRRIEHEHELENNRINWFLAFQGFLFAAVSLGPCSSGAIAPFSYAAIVPWTGVAIGVATLVGVRAAHRARDGVKAWLEEHPPATDEIRMAPSARASLMGRGTSVAVPIIVIVAWLAIIFGS